MKLLYEINYRQSELRHEQHNPAAEICVISRRIETGPNYCQILKPHSNQLLQTKKLICTLKDSIMIQVL